MSVQHYYHGVLGVTFVVVQHITPVPVPVALGLNHYYFNAFDNKQYSLLNIVEAGELPQGIVTIGTIVPETFVATAPFSYSLGDATSFEYRLDLGPVVEVAASPIFISDLTKATLYSLEVRAVNEFGEGSWSAAVEFTTASLVIVGTWTVNGISITLE